MSVQQDKFTEIANAIRVKDGTAAPIVANDFAERILAIPSGGYSPDWEPDPLWWDVKAIIEADETPGYVASMIVLCRDDWQQSIMAGADAFRTSDGAFYELPNQTTLVTHNWVPSAYQVDSAGARTKYIIRYYKTATIANPGFGNNTNASAKALGAWPIGIICKDASIAASGWLQNNYSLVFYDHINCVYTGTSVANMLGAANCYCLQSIPGDWSFASAINTFGSAFTSRSLKTLDLTSFDFANLTATSFTSFLSNLYLLEQIEGTVDCSKATAMGSLLGQSYMLRIATFRNIKLSWTLVSSVMSLESMDDLIRNGLVDLTGKTAQTLTSGSNNVLTEELRAIATSKNWIIA